MWEVPKSLKLATHIPPRSTSRNMKRQGNIDSALRRALIARNWEQSSKCITHEQASQRDTDEKKVALHHALENGAPLSVVKSLLDVYPEGALERGGYYDMCAIHYACEKNASLEVVQALLTAFPEGSGIKAKGMLPIFLALKTRRPKL